MGLDYRVTCCPDGLVTDRRRRIKVLDCTIRDGGICNDWQFDHPMVKRVFESLVRAGIDYMEVGYRTKDGCFDPAKVGPWRFCKEEDLAQVVEPGKIKLSTMLDIGRVETSDIPPKRDSVIDVIRIATYAHQLDDALDILNHCLEQGYETFMKTVMSDEEIESIFAKADCDGAGCWRSSPRWRTRWRGSGNTSQ